MITRSFFIITFIGLVAIVANGVKSTMNLASYFNDQPNDLAKTRIETQKSNKPQQRIADYVADNPRHGCIPQPALIDFDLAMTGDWIGLPELSEGEALDGYRSYESGSNQWGFMNCGSINNNDDYLTKK